ncbi:MAG TPA: NBR1-Ig-like domain-containing protein [Anaerolineales bacterium]|nr:NBR1-Ig-like domain-containing protein [Anaerolineales bacterium]
MRTFVIYLLLLGFLTACQAVVQTPAQTATPTRDISSLPAPTQPAVAETASPTTIPNTPEAQVTRLPALFPSSTPQLDCINDAEFVADLSVPDFSTFVAGALIDKQWQIKNTGTCHWDSRYRVVFSEGAQMNASAEQLLYPAKSGALAVVRIKMYAPDLPGNYRSFWILQDAQGTRFGPRLFVQITVGG